MAGRRRSDRALRGKLGSPGRPGVARREDRRRFWAEIAAGQSSEDAAACAGVSPAVGARWFREAGGMPPAALAPSSKPPAGRHLSFAEREELAILRAQGFGVREIGRQLGQSGSTISREMRRNAATRGRGLEYRATTAQWHAERAAQRPKTVKLAVNSALRGFGALVHNSDGGCRAPDQSVSADALGRLRLISRHRRRIFSRVPSNQTNNATRTIRHHHSARQANAVIIAH